MKDQIGSLNTLAILFFVVVVSFGGYFVYSSRENRKIDKEEMRIAMAEMNAVTEANKIEGRIMTLITFIIAIAAIVIPLLSK
jgi:hypothetical protein